jgi:PAS domain S-box-containing protein
LWDEKIDSAVTDFDDLKGNSYHSPQANVLLGYTGTDVSPISLQTWDEHVLPEDRADRERRQRDHFEGKTAYLDHEYRVRQKDGSIRWIHGRSRILRDDQGRPLRWIGIDWDVTEKKLAEEELNRYRESLEALVEERTAELQEANASLEAEIKERKQAEAESQKLQDQLLQSQKMEAVGRLTAGIAHDFNNLLMVINGYADQLQDEMRPEDPLRKPIDKIAQAGWHAADLVSQLMSFSRKQIMQPKTLNLSQVVADIHTMLQRTIGEDIQMETKLAANLWSVEADPSQLQQVLVNLVVNARDAMPGGGTLTIETSNTSLNEEFSADHIDVCPGDYVLVTVSDTGRGMSDDIKSRLFEPFFTTKELGQGTGLGLATVYGIVKQSGGHIWIDSTEGQGSTFRVYLPRAKADNRNQPESV